jgi:hypothetical protein
MKSMEGRENAPDTQKDPTMKAISFDNGLSFVSARNLSSIESRLSASWQAILDAMDADAFHETCMGYRPKTQSEFLEIYLAKAPSDLIVSI